MKILGLLLPLLASGTLAGQMPRAVLMDAVVDLRTTAGVARVNAQWRYPVNTSQRIGRWVFRSIRCKEQKRSATL